MSLRASHVGPVVVRRSSRFKGSTRLLLAAGGEFVEVLESPGGRFCYSTSQPLLWQPVNPNLPATNGQSGES